MQVHVTVVMDEKGNAALQAAPQIAQNRMLIYGLLQMGLELVHRMGDPPVERSRIVIPDLQIPS